MKNDEKTQVLGGSIFGIPGVAEIKKWRNIIDEAQEGNEPEYELCGLKEGHNGELLGIFRKKTKV